jgi:hypothetical protein
MTNAEIMRRLINELESETSEGKGPTSPVSLPDGKKILSENHKTNENL